jgi:hypothetical protein
MPYWSGHCFSSITSREYLKILKFCSPLEEGEYIGHECVEKLTVTLRLIFYLFVLFCVSLKMLVAWT